MKKHTAADGSTFTDSDVEQWGEEADAGFPGWQFGKPIAGRPISVGAEAKPFTIRLDAERRAKIDKAAEERHTTSSQLMRDLIDAL